MNAYMNRRREVRRGFTLMEVLLVLAILVVLFSISVGVYSNVQRSSNQRNAKIQVEAIDQASERFFAMTGRYPERDRRACASARRHGQHPVGRSSPGRRSERSLASKIHLPVPGRNERRRKTRHLLARRGWPGRHDRRCGELAGAELS